jgi:hypothetical protein
MFNLKSQYESLEKRIGYHFYNHFTSPYWNKYFQHVNNLNLFRSAFILSFDCDSEEDYKVVKEMNIRLSDMGIKSTFAVPVQLLKRGESEYQYLQDYGSVFINHGYRKHTFWDLVNNVNASSFFYDKIPSAVWQEDIFLADEYLKNFSSRPIEGFRTPHFGTFQNEYQLNELHEQLIKYGYLYSSSTTPTYLMQNGFTSEKHGLIEIPVTGSFKKPITILDSWNYFKSPIRKHTPEDYLENILGFLGMIKKGHKIFLNLYADPSHVAHSEIFYIAMSLLAKNADSLFFEDLVNIKK